MGEDMAKIQDEWLRIVQTMGIDLTSPLSQVTASDIKRITGKEPRLVASMHSKNKLPEVFRDNGVFVLPVSGDSYVIVHGKGYHELEPIESSALKFRARFPFGLTMLAYGTGEGRYLLHAYNSGLLSRFSNVREMYQTTAGKMRTGKFEFRVDGSPNISVDGAGMEIDMGFEGRSDVLLFEAKARRVDDFLIRQLYYPMRVAGSFTNKTVRAFFFVADPKDETYSIWEYSWTDPHDYESIKLVRSARFAIQESEAPIETLETVEPDPSLDIVPQADDFQKVADFPLLVHTGIDTAKKWAQHYGITERQGSYYREATEAMGLVTSKDGQYVLTNEGLRYVEIDQQSRADFLAIRILKIPIMNEVFRQVQLHSERGIEKGEIATLIEKKSHLRGSTPARRAGTVMSYFRWMARATGTVLVTGTRIYPRKKALEDFTNSR
jgi:hypothetical protein